MTPTEVKNVIIAGSGPAGYTAALYTARASLKPLLIKGLEVGGQLTTTTDVENFPGFPEGVLGPELMSLMEKQAKTFGTNFVSGNVKKVDLSSQPFQVFTRQGLYLTHSLIISTGASAQYLGVKGEKEYLGRGVSACATCDGFFFKGCEVCVVGGGDTAMEEALFLTRFAQKVWIIHRRDSFRASPIMANRSLSHEKIEVLWNTELLEVIGNENKTSVKEVKLINNKTNKTTHLPVEGVFIAIGHRPNTNVFKDQIEMDQKGYIVTSGSSTRTSVEGVFAAGDVQDSLYRQAVTAAGSGCMAAIDAQHWLEEKNFPSK